MTHWDWRQRSIAEVLWPSFLVAGVACILVFAQIDPDSLQISLHVQTPLSHTAVYSLGFFFFWCIAALSSFLTTWLIRTERRQRDFPESDRKD